MNVPSDAYLWILYLDPTVHTQEYKLIVNASLDSYVLIQDIRNAPSLEPWMSVLPALVDTRKKLAYRGPTCLKKLVSIDLPPEHAKRLAKRRKAF
jgi:hypothetical protein